MRDVTYWPLSRTQRSLEPPRHARTVILNTCLPPHRLLGVVERPPAPKRATHPFSQNPLHTRDNQGLRPLAGPATFFIWALVCSSRVDLQ